tara:strand:- start:212 stop:421 length:210 start_codon:yes stop_codon:yes gene_type:complete
MRKQFKIGDLVKSNFIAGMMSQRGLGIIIQHKKYGMEVNAYKIHWAGSGSTSWEAQRLIERVAKIDDSI